MSTSQRQVTSAEATRGVPANGADPRGLPGRQPSIPPGPRLPVAAQTAINALYRAHVMPRYRRRYGDMFTIRMAPHERTVVHLTQPDQAKIVYTGSKDVFHAGEGNAPLEIVMGRHSVLLLDGDEHTRVRQALMPAFSNSAIKGYGEMMTAVVRSELAKWPVGRSFAVHPYIDEMALEIILHVVFGVTDQERMDLLRSSIRRLTDVHNIALLAYMYEPLRGHWPAKKFGDAKARMDDFVYEEIALRRTSPDLAERRDVLSRLLNVAEDKQFTDEELRDHLVTLLTAGHETTATAIAWCIHALARHPEIQQKGRESAQSEDNTYLDAISKESMRLHPIVDGVAYVLKQDTEIGDYLLPAGVEVMVNVGLIHADPANFPDPGRFDPERFIGHQPPANTWMPFGGGPRRCMGAGFSMVEEAVILRELLTAFTIDTPLTKWERPVAKHLTLAPAKGAVITLHHV